MNREIIFRGKRKDNDEWVYGYYMVSDKNGCDSDNIETTHWILPLGSFYFCKKIEVIPESVGQNTGLKDLKYNEIYEGDIFLSKYFDERIDSFVKRKAVIIFEDGCFMVSGVNNKNWITPLINIIGGTWTIKLLGNKFENPELLK